ncbi:zinc finger SWIM domain-containing protein 1 [Bufo bufo]|uniref:zinc finger SWIM domain-containing protein 1 n=1 Tax=Bufo bufo TaxID=8384 RepID=UPI001ABE23A2|nr:zinc finger SWIM domain-containing protein 1 [Bufo bufo]XP_040293388.1 zinc finger SWIM domain-containing protein 1 [Bufo bufo]
MNAEFLQELMIKDSNSKVVCQLNLQSNINYLSLQTTMMSEVFSKFPEVLLMIRSYNVEQRALYTFLADGPCVSAPFEITRIVHVAIPPNETPKGLAVMFHIMKELNPSWPSIQVFLVDPDFTDLKSIHEAFPSAQVVLSACHVYAHIQQYIHDLFLPEKAKNILLTALKNTVCCATEGNLKSMRKILQRFVDACKCIRMLMHMKPDWLLTDRIWALHRWRSWNDCSQYFRMVGNLTCELNAVFKTSPCLVTTMRGFISFLLGQTVGEKLPEPRSCSPEELALIKCKVETSESVALGPQMEPEAAALMCTSLTDICNPAALGLCQNELEVTQKSFKLVGTTEDTVCVQVLENPNMVSFGIHKTCTCGFYQCTQLPCRHILSVLNASEEILQPDMLHTPWRKQANGLKATSPMAADTLEIMKAKGNNVSEAQLLANSLTSQISVLLAECSEETFQHRYNTLRELADAWIGPYDQVKL